MGGRRLGAIGAAALVLSLVPGNAAQAATIWIWPSSAPCDTTLQACVDNASSGDEVLIAQSGPINEQVTIKDKSLTLEPETGFSPELSSLIVTTQTPTGPVGVLVEGVHVAHTIFVSLSGGSGHTVTLDHVTAQSSGADPGIYGTIYHQSTVNVLHSSVTQSGFYPGIELTSPSGNNEDLTWNVEGNTISGELASMTQAGISLSVTDARSLRANVFNNSVWNEGQGVTSGNHGGILLFARDSSGVNVNVVGNSLDKIQGDGVNADNELSSPNRFAVDLFDNVIARASGAAVFLATEAGSTGQYALRGGQNDLYSNGHPNHLLGQSIGPFLTHAPEFLHPANGDLQLHASSPLRDKGDTCSPGGVAGPDAAGRNRLFGTAVDIGAYEWNGGVPGVVDMGTSGPDTLSGSPHPDILCGYGGNDTLLGVQGADYLGGGMGTDHLFGGADKDRLYGGKGNDLLCARDGAPGDYLNGGRGTDSYRADGGDTKVSVEKLGSCAAP